MKVVPIGPRLLVQRHAPPEDTGLIARPETAKEKPMEATVLALGQPMASVNGHPPANKDGVTVGDTILIGKYTGTEIVVEGQECLIIREEEVLGRLLQEGGTP